MLIIDDRLTFDVLTAWYGWLPEGHGPAEQVRMRARLANPAPHVTILDPRLTLRLAAELAGRFRLSNHVQAEPLAAALHYRAALALTAWSERLVSACDSCGIELHRIPRPK